MSGRIPSISAHKQFELQSQGFHINYDGVFHSIKAGKDFDAFCVSFWKGKRLYRFRFGFFYQPLDLGSIAVFHNMPLYLVNQKDQTKERISEDSKAMATMDRFFKEIGFTVFVEMNTRYVKKTVEVAA